MEKTLLPETIHTERLTLRRYRREDEADIVDILRNDEVSLTYMLPDFPTRESAVKLFDRLLELSHSEEHVEYAVCLGDRVIGFFNDVEMDGDTIEVGYVIHPSEKSRGFATEALTALIQALFSAGFSTVRCGYFEENPASGRVMEKSGMKAIEKTDEIEYRGAMHRCLYREIRRNGGE